MKKLFFTSIAVFYLFLSIGVYVDAHYCHGHLSSVTYFTDNSDCECGRMETMTCCFDKEQYVHIDAEALVMTHVDLSELPPQETLELLSELDSHELPTVHFKSIEDEGGGEAKYILYQSLVLYA